MEKTSATQPAKLDDLMRALETRLPGAHVEALHGFTSRLLARGAADLVDGRPVERVAEEIAALYELLDRTEPGEIGVRVSWDEEDRARGTLQTVMEDCPFIVDTLREYLHSLDLDIPRLLHPVVVVQRDARGHPLEVRQRSEDGALTSLVHIAISGAHEPEIREEIEPEVRRRLSQVRAVTEDFQPMLDRVSKVVAELEEKKKEIPWRGPELEEVQELLRWMADPGFVFLGYRRYSIEADEAGRNWISVDEDSGLGILRHEEESKYREPTAVDALPADLRARVLGGPLLIVSKTNAESPVRRRARMDYIGVKRLSPDGTIRGEHRFLGLFTAKAYGQEASTIPILRRKLREILQQEGAPRGSHDYNVILQTFNSMPKEELFLASVEEIRAVIDTVMQTEGADEVTVTSRPDQLGRGVNVMIILPRNRFSAEIRRKLQSALVDAYQGRIRNYHLALGQGDQARLHFYLGHDGEKEEERDGVDLKELEAVVRATVRTWEEQLEGALEEEHGATRAHELTDHLAR
ncbi:MAG: NAD-glutamate dehydrogenase, partial [Gemmatimonadota bacterium]|nr:NAD-glutamate dehydrogenase [Gemmatimonadota bacterium]